jgi:hypothetical protein
MTLIVPAGSFASKAVGVLKIGWGLAMGPYGKLILYGAILVGGLWWFRLWLNKHDGKVFQQGRNQAVQTMTKDFESRLQVELAGAKAMKDNAAEDRKVAEALSAKIDAKFGAVFVRLDTISLDVKKRDVIYVQKTDAIPVSELPSALRDLSNAIARQFPIR